MSPNERSAWTARSASTIWCPPSIPMTSRVTRPRSAGRSSRPGPLSQPTLDCPVTGGATVHQVNAWNRMFAEQRRLDLLRRADRAGLARKSRASRSQPRYGLPRELWLIVFGIFVNYVGYGGVLPFEVIYLHDGRGFGLGTAGLVIGLITGVA